MSLPPPLTAPAAGVGRSAAILLLLAAIFVGLNAAKPLHMDDTFVYRVAEQIAQHPGDPYGFEVFWVQWPQPAHEELTPPLVPYWWALGLRWLGESVVLWKLWLFPFGALFAAALWAVLRRLARGVELPVVALTMLSPAFLPSLNFMQDVPAAALGLAGLALYLAADRRKSLALAAAAGLVGGVAMQTKYTAAAFLAVMLIHGMLVRRVARATLAVAVAAALFVGWEAFLTLSYGQGMFYGQVRHGLGWMPRGALAWPLLQILGAVLAVPALLGLAALRVPRGAVLTACAALLAGTALLFALPVHAAFFAAAGIASSLAVAAVALRGACRGGPRRRTDRLLLAWLGLELVLYFVASPFPAVRRVSGLVLVVTLLCARAAALELRRRRGSIPLAAVLLTGIALGALYFLVDQREAVGQRRAAEEAWTRIRADDPSGSVWFIGHWGFQFYAERAGMRPVVPDVSLLRAGDWLVVPRPVHHQEIGWSGAAELVRVIRIEGFPPLRTGEGFYGGSPPLQHLEGPRLEARIYRVRRDFVPPTSWPAVRLYKWAVDAGGATAAAAVPALIRALETSDAQGRWYAARGLGEIGADAASAGEALARARDDPDPRVRAASAEALARVRP